jgi:lipid-binding SYLF domain-containing protein
MREAPVTRTLSKRNRIAMRTLFFKMICTFFVVSFVSSLCPTSPAEAATAVEIDAKSNAALEEFFSTAPAGKELAAKAVGILIFPSVVKAGMLVGGEYGEGALRIDGATVDYYSVAAGSIGLQFGVQKKGIVIMFMEKTALDNFRSSNGWEVGVDGSVALVTIGAGGSVDTNTAKQPIIGFVFGQKGLMLNLTLEGSKMTKLVR